MTTPCPGRPVSSVCCHDHRLGGGRAKTMRSLCFLLYFLLTVVSWSTYIWHCGNRVAVHYWSAFGIYLLETGEFWNDQMCVRVALIFARHTTQDPTQERLFTSVQRRWSASLQPCRAEEKVPSDEKTLRETNPTTRSVLFFIQLAYSQDTRSSPSYSKEK